ncbi:BTB/POZ domain-containing adapter for CUL3-mediated RhoA degradation protein 3 isoform X1 [Hydra vulgaris]|uniref:BTB/POZ domain-containing adapter for CUL3-mediated RhoA degradation protein 3 isoform X2 n=1 Tax=Hydra vulgaris TaxID=6087 RepID=A0ABM4CP07_HYDVU|nr:BTB/POZ domain-containing adapter for CUL3-mediated RhoA degradation protein 3 [Hydra vulgaris]
MSGETQKSIVSLIEDGGNKPVLTKYVKLNVGGSLFYTTLGTLTKRADSMLRAMFSGRMEVLTDTEGWVLIDRAGKHFGRILNYLRDGQCPMPEDKMELKELLAEAKYYCLQELINCVEDELKKKGDDVEPQCRVPLVTSSKEERMLIMNAEKPVIKLVCNRYNNKYSYTSQSDDNILKNLELFDKLSLRFNGRILFIKDIIANDEICCWSFYGNGKKVTEVCCTSIVYATERKQTKVDFPEARIYEDTLNILLFEGRGELAALDQLLRATKSLNRNRDRERDDNDEGSNMRRSRVHQLANDS